MPAHSVWGGLGADQHRLRYLGPDHGSRGRRGHSSVHKPGVVASLTHQWAGHLGPGQHCRYCWLTSLNSHAICYNILMPRCYSSKGQCLFTQVWNSPRLTCSDEQTQKCSLRFSQHPCTEMYWTLHGWIVVLAGEWLSMSCLTRWWIQLQRPGDQTRRSPAPPRFACCPRPVCVSCEFPSNIIMAVLILFDLFYFYGQQSCLCWGIFHMYMGMFKCFILFFIFFGSKKAHIPLGVV